MRYFSVESLRLMCDLLREQGLDASGLFDAAGVSPVQLLAPTVRIAGREELAAIRLFRQRAAELPALAVRIGQRHRLATFERTLRRQLAREGSSYRDVRKRVLPMLPPSVSPPRRWSGQTPSAFRKAAKLDELTYDLSSII